MLSGRPSETAAGRSGPRASTWGTAGHLAVGLETGLDAAALLFLPLLILAPRGVAALASVAGLFAAGLVLCSNRPIWRPDLSVPGVLIGLLLARARDPGGGACLDTRRH